ncbi:MAG TPA: hypothetical protein VJ787_06945 [Thermoleophilia bacterium]|nr:hypothetical protein [Thermoleophilia bacterium]
MILRIAVLLRHVERRRHPLDERQRHALVPRAKHGRQQCRKHVAVALARPADGREHLVNMCAVERAIPTRDLPHDHRGTNFLLAQVVRRRELVDVEVGEQLPLVPEEMLLEATVELVLHVAAQQARHAAADLAAPVREVVLGHRRRERLEQHAGEEHALHGVRETRGAALLHLEQLGTPTQQMRRALALPARGRDVCGPAVDAEDAAEVDAEDLVDNVATAAQADRVQGDARLDRREHPQPGLRCRLGDVPAGLVGMHHVGLAHEADERGVRRHAAGGDAFFRTHEGAGADAETKREQEDAHHLAVRRANAVLEVDGEAPSTRSDLHAGSTVRRRHLLGVPAAHSLLAPQAIPALVVKARRGEWDLGGQVDDDLRRERLDVLQLVAAAAGARRQRDVDVAIDARRGSAVRRRVAELAPGLRRVLLPPTAAEGARLPLRSTPRLLHLLAQRLVLDGERLRAAPQLRDVALSATQPRPEVLHVIASRAAHIRCRSHADPTRDPPVDRWRARIRRVRTPPRTVNMYEELTAEGAGGSAAIGAGFGVAFYALGRISPALATALVRGAVIAKSSEAALKAAVLIREGNADPKLVADVALDGALAALGVSAAVKGTGTPAPAPASASPGPPGAASVGGVAAEAAAEAPNITFGHGARHLVGTGLGREEVESAIGAEVRSVAAKAGLGGSFWGRVPVGGKTIEFRAFPLPGGRVNVGTYYPLE